MGYSGHPLLVHDLFGPSAILSNANESQLKNWLPKVQNSEIIVTYAQTELGHGTNLKMLETTATYDPNTEQFEIHSPTITSTKFWPGNLGLSANYVILQAQLFTLGKCYGPHLFIVQIRDLDTHKALPGIRVGEIGPKFEDNLMDNGYLSFDHVRIPRTNMLMKHCQILNDGTYVKPKHSKLGYSTMVEVRAFLLGKNAMHIAQACTIAIRYSCIRRQGKIDPTKDIETKILEYQTQQFRIFPHLARAFAYLATGRRIIDFSRNVLKDIRSGRLGLINELHAISSGLKAVITFNTSFAIEQCRLACGGHGYSLASGLPQLYAIVVAECTYEGENLVMLLQMARYLMKKERTRIVLKQDVNIFDELLDNDFWKIDASYKESLDMFKALANRKITDVYDRLEILKKQGKKEEYAWNECAVDLCKASRAYCRNFIAHIFVQYVNQIQEPTLRHLLEEILKLFLNFEITECFADLIEIGYMNGQKLVKVRNELNEVMKSIRVDAISIIDSFDFSDRELDSILGKRDGHVYE
uniref:Acyl-CoA oxidase C-terminal domain-containing protein n=1 Tax=Acrobeloides nanus TaxID=290746 RepID=A0A914CTW4_9BILA